MAKTKSTSWRQPQGTAAVRRRLLAGDFLHIYDDGSGYWWHGYNKEIDATPYPLAVRWLLKVGDAVVVPAIDGCAGHIVAKGSKA
jgi:hypothetical protein